MCYTYKIKKYMYRNDNIIVEIGCMIALRHFFICLLKKLTLSWNGIDLTLFFWGVRVLHILACEIFVYVNHTSKMSQSDHTTNFHDYVIISVHILLYFVSVAQFFAKLILSVAQFLYHKVLGLVIRFRIQNFTKIRYELSEI